jgi:hypothetical protein
VLVAPGQQAAHHGPERQPLVSEQVLGVAVRAVGTAQHPGLGQRAEPLGQHRPGHAQVRREVPEPSHAEERVAHDHQRPALADDLEGAGQGALLA